jgi:hypothetical protein
MLEPEILVRDVGIPESPMGYSIRPFEAIVGDGVGNASGNILAIYAYGYSKATTCWTRTPAQRRRPAMTHSSNWPISSTHTLTSPGSRAAFGLPALLQRSS